jgi:glycosyltransferase involved in cell wall biosynthesis
METVVDGKTGIFFEKQNADDLAEAVKKCSGQQWNSAIIRKNAERFSEQNFLEGLSACIKKCLQAAK